MKLNKNHTLRDWTLQELPDGVCLSKKNDLSSYGYFLLAPALIVTIVAFLDLVWGGDFSVFGLPIYWDDQTMPPPYMLFLFVATSLAIAGRAVQMNHGSEKWVARQHSLEIHKGLWGLRFVRRYENSELSIVCYKGDTSKGDKPEVYASCLVITPEFTPNSGREFHLPFHGLDSEQQALEFGQILSDNTGWPLFRTFDQIL